MEKMYCFREAWEVHGAMFANVFKQLKLETVDWDTSDWELDTEVFGLAWNEMFGCGVCGSSDF